MRILILLGRCSKRFLTAKLDDVVAAVLAGLILLAIASLF
jgi:hypothetical protein